jgi:tRNA dimethylallyltransferase
VRAYEGGKAMVAVGLDPGAGLAGRVEQRFDRMLGEGLLSEVAGLADRLGPTARQAVGYQQLLAVVRGEASLDAGRQAAISASLALAKRQRTFFRRDPRIRWLPWSDDPAERCRVALSVVEEARAWSS